MRTYLFFLIFIISTCAQRSQAQKHDYMWPLGFGPNKSEYSFFYNFNSDTPNVIVRPDTFSTGLYSASYCNKNGQIIFFSNGQKIFDQNGVVVENGEQLNPTIMEWQSQYQNSYPGGQSGFFLEKPNDPNTIYFVSLDFGLHPAQKWPYVYVGQNLMVATIDVLANSGMGKVIEKNKILLTGTLMSPAACRHANGRDWWIMVSDADENRHYRVLLTPEGFSLPDTQYIGTKPNPIPYLGRCSGLLSNERRVDYPVPIYPNHYQNYSGSGAVFSQNDSLFYKTTRYSMGSFPPAPLGTVPYLLQYDLSYSDLASKVDTINIVDSSDYHFPTNITWDGFYGAELGPDGRIYVVHTGLGYCTVQYPDIKGRGCKFIHDKPFFDVVISQAIPYMPNYRLGPLDGSPCDTLGLNNIPVANFRVDDTLGFFSRYFYDLSHHEPGEWHWSFGDGQTSTAQSPLHQYDAAGVYQVCLTVSNQYGSDTYCRTLYLGVSSTENPVQESQVMVFPNPFSQQLVVYLGETHHSPVFLLYNAAGQLVHKGPLATGINEIQATGLNKGMYFWEITRNRQLVRSGKVIKTE
jgi:PKD repeat protein